jgi:hypothetical protein
LGIIRISHFRIDNRVVRYTQTGAEKVHVDQACHADFRRGSASRADSMTHPAHTEHDRIVTSPATPAPPDHEPLSVCPGAFASRWTMIPLTRAMEKRVRAASFLS